MGDQEVQRLLDLYRELLDIQRSHPESRRRTNASMVAKGIRFSLETFDLGERAAEIEAEMGVSPDDPVPGEESSATEEFFRRLIRRRP